MTRMYLVDDAEVELFRDHADASGPLLLRTGYLLTDSWDESETLVRRALARTYLRWRSVGSDDPIRHTMRALVRMHVGRRWWPRRPVHRDSSPRGEVWPAVQTLPRIQRAALVLRCFHNQSIADTGHLLGRSPRQADRVLTRAMDTLGRVVPADIIVDGRSLPTMLADDMARRTARVPVVDRHETFMAIGRRAQVTRYGRLVAALATALAAVTIGMWGASALSVRTDDQPSAGTTTAATPGATTTAARATPQPSAGPPSGTPSATPSLAAPTAQLEVPLILGRRIVQPGKGAVRTLATITSGAEPTGYSAGDSYVVRSGPTDGRGVLTLVTSTGTRQLATRAGSAVVNAAGTRIAYVERDSRGNARRLLLLALPGGEPMQALAAPFRSTEVKGFVGEAVLFEAETAAGDRVARRWNPVANDVTTLGGGYSAVLAVHARSKLAVLADSNADCTTAAFIEFGTVHPRGRTCDRQVAASAFSPDGERVALVLRDGSRVLVAGVREGLPTVASFAVDAGIRQLAWESDGALAVVTGADTTTEVLRCSIRAQSCAPVWSPGADVELVR